MTTTTKKDLHVETAEQQSLSGGPSPGSSGDNQSPPSVAPLSIQSSSSSSSASEADMTEAVREQEAKKFVLDVGLHWSDCTVEQKARAEKMQSLDFAWSPTKGDAPANSRYATTFKAEWEKFVGNLPEPHRTAFSTFEHVFFDEAAMTNYMAIHGQLSDIGSSHASVLVQHYSESSRRGSQEENHTMLDISSFIRKDLPKDVQERYIQEGVTGYNSFELLQLFTGTKGHNYRTIKPCRKSEHERYHRSDIKNLFDTYVENGPGLVSYFKVGGEFYENAILEGPLDEERYDQIVAKRGGKGNIHAMVLIGAYRSDDDRYWFLLQKTHRDSYFKLVDGEHLASCDADVSFALLGSDMSLKGNYYDVVFGGYSEAALDMEECTAELVGEG